MAGGAFIATGARVGYSDEGKRALCTKPVYGFTTSGAGEFPKAPAATPSGRGA